MKHFLFLILSIFLFFSCSTTQKQVEYVDKIIRDTIYVEKFSDDQGKIIQSAILENYKISDVYFPALGQDFRQKFIIIHYTALHNQKSVEVLTQQAVSSHYLIKDNEDENIYVLVGENERAWHAGQSSWLGRTNINDSSIGIEIVNQGYSMHNGNVLRPRGPCFVFGTSTKRYSPMNK